MKLPTDYAELLAAFEKAGAKYLVVGGYALAIHGAPRFTKDIDIFIGDSDANLTAVVAALTNFGAPPSTIEAVKNLSHLDVAWMGNPPLRIDIMKEIPGVQFQEAFACAHVFEIDGQKIWVISKELLVIAKQASGRPQDLVDIEKLTSK